MLGAEEVQSLRPSCCPVSGGRTVPWVAGPLPPPPLAQRGQVPAAATAGRLRQDLRTNQGMGRGSGASLT